MQDFVDVFEEISGLPPKRDIDLSIDLMPGVAPVSKIPYIMTTPKLKDINQSGGMSRPHAFDWRRGRDHHGVNHAG